MKFLSIAFVFVLVHGFVSAQDYRGSVTVFSEGGEKFTLFLNGDRKNGSPDARVVVDNVTELPVSFRIVFENASLKEIKKNGFRQGRTCIYAIVANKKGEHSLKVKDCQDPFDNVPAQDAVGASSTNTQTITTPDQLTATYTDGIISINDGRQLTVTKVKVNGMTYPRLIMNAPQGAKASIKYDDSTEQFSAEVPLQYEVKDFSNNNAFFTLTVDEGGPAKTWHVKLKNNNGFDLKVE